MTVCVCVMSACRQRSTNCVSRSRFSRRNSVVRSWHCVVYRRRAHVSSARSPAKRRPSTSTATSVSSCVTVRCWTLALDPSTICVLRARPVQMTSIVSQRSRNSLVRRVKKALLPSLAFLVVYRYIIHSHLFAVFTFIPYKHVLVFV